MEIWKKHIQLGNQHFSGENYQDAEQEYHRAIARSQQLFDSWFDNDEAVWSLVVSYQNLADLFEKINRQESALNLLEQLDRFLTRKLERIKSNSTSSEERKLSIHRGLSNNFTQLLSMQKKLNSQQRQSRKKSTQRIGLQ